MVRLSAIRQTAVADVERNLPKEHRVAPELPATTVSLYEESLEEIRSVYLADERPWVIGFSGGKDSTVALQLVWYALRGLDPSERRKPVYVISGDTQAETP